MPNPVQHGQSCMMQRGSYIINREMQVYNLLHKNSNISTETPRLSNEKTVIRESEKIMFSLKQVNTFHISLWVRWLWSRSKIFTYPIVDWEKTHKLIPQSQTIIVCDTTKQIYREAYIPECIKIYSITKIYIDCINNWAI